MRLRFSLIRVLCVFGLVQLVGLAASAQDGQVVYEIKSQYQHITVWDSADGYRRLIFDAKMDGTDPIQSEMNLAKPNELTLAYARHMITALPLVGKPNRILVIGLGGACIQRYLHGLLPNATVETAELDPAVVDVACRFFSLKPDDRQKVHVGDGRKFLEQSRDKYDLIMLDAFSAESIPFMLSTKEFLEICRDHLAAGGVVCANLWCDSDDYHSMVKTYSAVFAEWHILRCPRSSNAILVALPSKQGLSADKWMKLAEAFDRAHRTGLNLARLVDRAFEERTRIPTDANLLLDADVKRRP